jgi:FRG domain-containing protein
MTEIFETTVTNLNEYLDAAQTIGMASPTRTLWYRGTHDASYPLVPRLYRSDSTAAELLATEQEMLAQFRSRGRPLLADEVRTEWEFLFVMQHYGVPTRLLDWSENAFLALYFALSAASARDFGADAAVWVLDPATWNVTTFPAMDSPGKALHADENALNNYEPGRELNNMASEPAAMYALYNNPRITAQRGVFTVFGRDKRSIHDWLESKEFPDKTLTRLTLPRQALADMYEQVRILGFRESMIYPDLGGLAKEIRTEQGLL